MLKTNQIFFIPIEPVKKVNADSSAADSADSLLMLKGCVLKKVGPNESNKNERILKFKTNCLDKFLHIAQLEIDQFDKRLNKIQTSLNELVACSNNDTTSVENFNFPYDINSSKFKRNLNDKKSEKHQQKQHQLPTHFSDLANMVMALEASDRQSMKMVEFMNRHRHRDTANKTKVVATWSDMTAAASALSFRYRTLPTQNRRPSLAATAAAEAIQQKFVEVEIEQHSDDEQSSEIITRLWLRTGANVRSNSMPNKVARQAREAVQVKDSVSKKCNDLYL